ncbi:101 kDa malaria antigen-like [Trichoplusia ni]|uniref:101 kDa malaria antigen-like n=1 Tax=Trichoplusia ni TaxID=7111 RepID=A0A7E5WIU7_TRINI|nr:101 kDa malaria antigen-like [Trichoplusia ni]
MASYFKPALKEINGVNLANYFPHQRSFNSVVFIHKKFLDEPKYELPTLKSKKEKKLKGDKSQQFNSEKNTELSKARTYKVDNGNVNDSVLEQTIRFAKNIVPLVIPPSEDKLPVYYTIKTAKKHKKKEKMPQEPTFEPHEMAYPRNEGKKVIETYRKVRKESFSVRESVSHCSNNTLDDLNINQSISCSFSEVSEKKYHKKEKEKSHSHSHSKKHIEAPKVVVSESFEAIATENAGDSRIKIHLMTDKDKSFLTDSIKVPVLNAIRDCIAELNGNSNTEITTVQKTIKCNTQKLDTILDKLACIEQKLDAQEKKLAAQEKEREKQREREREKEREKERENLIKQVQEKKVESKVQVSAAKPSKLEELGADLIEIKEDYSSEEELHQELLDRRSKSVVVDFMPDDKSDRKTESLGGGEVGSTRASSSVGIKPDRPNRIPARFCWTDVARK